MGNIHVVLRREDGTIIDELEDGQSELARLLRRTRDDVAYPYLRFIDPIDDTTFTRQQMSALVPELRRLAEATQSAPVRRVLNLAQLCEATSHSRLSFIGD